MQASVAIGHGALADMRAALHSGMVSAAVVSMDCRADGQQRPVEADRVHEHVQRENSAFVVGSE